MAENIEYIAYCSLYCKDCFGYKGDIASLSKELRQYLRKEKFTIMVKGIPFVDEEEYKVCYKVLGNLVRLKCSSGCRHGGGNPFCKIRKCCIAKKIEGCWECNETESCKKLIPMKSNHGDALYKNLSNIKKTGLNKFISGKKYWYVKEKDKK